MPPSGTVVELYDDLSRLRCIEIPQHTLRYVCACIPMSVKSTVQLPCFVMSVE